ncbi:MAG: beta-glucosidase BglX [Bacteroidota bacterium]
MKYFLVGCLCLSAALNSILVAQQSIDQRVEDLLQKMTLEEKIGQMNQYNGFWEATGPVPAEGDAKKKYDHLKSGQVGSVLNVRGVKQVREMQKLVVEESRLGIPMIFASDVIHGYKTLAPIPLAEAASWDMEAIEQSARVAAIEASAVGVNWTFAPMVDISRDARWGRVMEGGGEDPYLGAKIGAARVRGFQGDDLSANNTILACAKHFAGYGFAEAGREYNTVDIGRNTLYNFVFPPFEACIDAGVRTVMNSFNILNGIPATGDEWLQRDILKDKWSFEGFVVSDWGSGGEMIAHGFTENLEQAAVLGANAGSDMDMESYMYVSHLKKAVADGRVDEQLVDDAVRRILRTKFELGLFDDPYKYCDETREQNLLYHKDHQAAVLDVAKKSIVLLKNEGNLLPLKKSQSKIAVIGALADDKNSPLGSWRIGSDDNTAVSVLEGLRAYSDQLTYEKGADLVTDKTDFVFEVSINEDDTSGFAAAIDLAKASEVVIMVLGEHGFQTGEGRSRTQLDLPGVQQELLEAVYTANSNIILVLMNGRPLALPWAAENVPAIVEAWQLGSQTGKAVAATLFGDNNPSGKLPMTFPKSVGQVPIYYNHYRTGRPNSNPTVFWSHYSDEQNEPLFPFGFGLSYTTFDYSNLVINAQDAEAIQVSVTVRNSGELAGQEVVQLYLSDPVASVVRPVKELKGFEKITLAPGDSRTVKFTLTPKELGFYDHEGKWIVEPGLFQVMVGTSSQKGLKAEFRL